MRLKRFFCKETMGTVGTTFISYGDMVNQLKNVFRLTNGDKVLLFDGSGHDFVATITGYEKDHVSFTIEEILNNDVSPKKEIYLFASIVKKDTFEWIVQKATELGVAHIVPILSERSEKKNLNIERLKKIIIEASEQSGRATLPKLHDITTLKDCSVTHGGIKSVVWHIQAPKFVSQDLVEVQGTYIGPEGGWSEKELEMFKEKNIKICSLGPQVLRAETAVVATLSQLVF
jgi:16S rRNA (uracil1498-N3)-methyltransferase